MKLVIFIHPLSPMLLEAVSYNSAYQMRESPVFHRQRWQFLDGLGVKALFWLLVTCLFSSCISSTRAPDLREYAITTCAIQGREVELAQTRARDYLSRHAGAADEANLLAVEVDYVFPSEVPDLWVKLGRSQTASSAYVQRRGQSFKLWCVLLVDRTTLLPVTRQGYVLANTPARGAIAKIGGRQALYIGRGNF